MRRLEGEHLPLLVHHRINFRKCGARANRQHQFARLVVNDATVATHVHGFTDDDATVKRFCVAAVDSERGVGGGGGFDTLAEGLDEGFHVIGQGLKPPMDADMRR